MVALSRITLPMLPVSVKLLPDEALRLLSMNKISPPTGVQANPVTTPAVLLFS